MTFRHILLTTDLSQEAARAFEPVAELARSFQSRITLLHVVQVMSERAQGGMLATPILPPEMNEAMRAAERELEAQGKPFEGLDVTVRVVSGQNVSEIITEYAHEHETDLIALSTHGRSGLQRMILGSVAEGVLRHANTPVLCFPPPR